jgi:hypothetical protein
MRVYIQIRIQAALDLNVADEKVLSDLVNVPLKNKDFDITLSRYVLAWNSLDNQRKIIENIKEMTRGVAIVQHQGSKNDSDLLKQASKKLFSGLVEDLTRDEFYFSSAKEIENILNELGIKYEIVQDRTIEGLSDVFIKKYSLDENDEKTTKDILKDSDYIQQTTFVLDFRD